MQRCDSDLNYKAQKMCLEEMYHLVYFILRLGFDGNRNNSLRVVTRLRTGRPRDCGSILNRSPD
jgi:hypothetical protein